MAPMIVAAPMFSAAAFAASSAVSGEFMPRAAPIAAISAVSRTVSPIAVSHPKKAEPNLKPPKRSSSRESTSRRRLVFVAATASVSSPA